MSDEDLFLDPQSVYNAKVPDQSVELRENEAAKIMEYAYSDFYNANPMTTNMRAGMRAAYRAIVSRLPKRESGELEYLKEWHHVTQHLIGTVGLYFGRGEPDKARARFEHYRDQLPKRDIFKIIEKLNTSSECVQDLNTWQLIGTAPKNKLILIARWGVLAWEYVYSSFWANGWALPFDGERDEDGTPYLGEDELPTHWMLMPEAPTTKIENQS